MPSLSAVAWRKAFSLALPLPKLSNSPFRGSIPPSVGIDDVQLPSLSIWSRGIPKGFLAVPAVNSLASFACSVIGASPAVFKFTLRGVVAADIIIAQVKIWKSSRRLVTAKIDQNRGPVWPFGARVWGVPRSGRWGSGPPGQEREPRGYGLNSSNSIGLYP